MTWSVHSHTYLVVPTGPGLPQRWYLDLGVLWDLDHHSSSRTYLSTYDEREEEEPAGTDLSRNNCLTAIQLCCCQVSADVDVILPGFTCLLLGTFNQQNACNGNFLTVHPSHGLCTKSSSNIHCKPATTWSSSDL